VIRARAPIALFVYRRVDHVRRTIEALALNSESAESDLIVFSDGPKGDTAAVDVAAVREYLKSVTGFRSINIVESERNLGLARSIITGVSQVLNRRDRVIVMEDDLVTSPHFLRYMNDALSHYRDDDRVASIHGYVYPVDRPLPETFFLRGADCWGWATWRRGWSLFNPNGRELFSELQRRKLTRHFDFDGTFEYTKMLENQIAGTNDSWAVRWYASAFLREKLTLYPGRSLVQNIGNDSTGAHCETTNEYDVSLTSTPVRVGGIPVEDSRVGRNAFVEFGRRIQPRRNLRAVLRRLVRRAIRWR
jgi:hypothetical protein